MPSSPRVLCVGFENEILKALRAKFDVCCTISADPSADVNWDALYLLNVNIPAPVMDGAYRACFDSVSKDFLRFSDINSRRHYYVTPAFSNVYNSFVLSFHACYDMLVRHRIDLVLFANVPHEGFDFVLMQIARFMGIRAVMGYQSLMPNRFWLTEKVEDFGLPDHNPVLFQREASDYHLPEQWFYMKKAADDASYSWAMLLKEVVRRPWRIPAALVRFVYARQYRLDVANLTRPLPSGERYIYFPLHLQPELTTSALGGDYSDQMLALETLSAWVPQDVKIYVKENPKQTEKQRDRFFYKRLSALKNVTLLSNVENSIDLIRNSIGVATITGTAGWEALFHGKPVIAFGLAWYRFMDGVFAFRHDLAFDDFASTVPPSAQRLAEELDNALVTAGRGIIDDNYRAIAGDGFDAEANALSVAESLAHYVARKYAGGEGSQ
jgi:Capsule polysaccharide biosynthesis protein